MSLMSPALAGRFFTNSTTWEAQSNKKKLKMQGVYDDDDDDRERREDWGTLLTSRHLS